MTTDANEIPRRARVDQMSAGELGIRQAVAEVEGMGADYRLTDAVVLLGKAQSCVADYVDGRHYAKPHAPTLARRMYDAYGDKAGWVTFDGRPMPQWSEVGAVVQARWEAAAIAAIADLTS